MPSLEFRLTKFKEESSRDSNSQFEHINYKNGVLSFVSEWAGYHPQGGEGKMPSRNFQLKDSKIKDLMAYIEGNGFYIDQNKTTADKKPSPNLPESNSYGFRLKIVKDNKTYDWLSNYTTNGPRDERFEKTPQYKKLSDLFVHLESLRYSDGVSEKILTAEEREAESFFNRNGYKINEKPKFVSRMTYYLQRQKTDRDKVYDTTPFIFQYNNGGSGSFFVVYRDATTEKRIEYLGKPEFFEKLADLLVQLNLHEAPKSFVYESTGLPPGEFLLKHNFEVCFNQISTWRLNYTFSHLSSTEIRQKNSGPNSLILRFEKLSDGIEELLKSNLVTVIDK